ncbi:MAG: hypothetical protein ACRDGU_01990 [Actinomycetota bacterium]
MRVGTIPSVRVLATRALLVAMLVLGVAATTTFADPAGNNGTVMVGGVGLADPGNEPHLGCTFQIEFYGYDEDAGLASYVLEGHAPTGGGTLDAGMVFIGGDPAGGANDLDAVVVVDLTAALAGIPPQPEQGHHVKLTVHADGSQGADVKHKTFWVSCDGDGGGDDGGGDDGGGDNGGEA